MRPLSISAFGLAAALALSVSPATGAVATSAVRGVSSDADQPFTVLATDSGEGFGRSVSMSPAARARATLRVVESTFAGEPGGVGSAAAQGRDMTLLLRDLRAGLGSLSTEDRSRAEAFLARPTDGPADPGGTGYDVPAANDCATAPTVGSNVCVHWATSGADAPSLTDGDVDGVPDFVESARDELNYVWNRLVVQGGYLAPLSDATSSNAGPDAKLDVYLADIGPEGLYGYCTSDDPSPVNYKISAYCVLDNDYAVSEFPTNTPLENLQVTAVHEFFHAVQFAYDVSEDRWFMEGTAAWIEDEIYDDVDDNIAYLDGGPAVVSFVPLDFYGDWNEFFTINPYGNWQFWRFLTERFSAEDGSGMPVLMREMWERAAGAAPTQPGDYSMKALTKLLAAEGTSMSKVYAQFGVANRRPAKFYEEGANYPASLLYAKGTFNSTKIQPLKFKPWHLTNSTTRVAPGTPFSGKTWKLRLKLDLPNRSLGYGAAVTVFPKSGPVTNKYLKLDASGAASVAVPFSKKKVKYVEITVTNGSTRYDCPPQPETVLSCGGYPLDWERPVKIEFKPFR